MKYGAPQAVGQKPFVISISCSEQASVSQGSACVSPGIPSLDPSTSLWVEPERGQRLNGARTLSDSASSEQAYRRGMNCDE